ncbi:M1 family metallopeptidase [Chitinophaga filiformis]|uniref:Aminopeptidase N n=1 Tax=Chitinophaga filiformis TaxID=104663 RepID=A0A1G8B724_CHIFI|nr:M1 family metallopeptidase [Chitinophaga filiformis]SDH28986.1 aminopeptidase N [Chitinophaga filiformis]
MKNFLFVLWMSCYLPVTAQVSATTDTLWKQQFRGSEARINDLVHVRLELKPDFVSRSMAGKAWITLKPHFYPTDSLCLDAKKMVIEKVGIVSDKGDITPLKYIYKDSARLYIRLNKLYAGNEKYQVYIAYKARDNEERTDNASVEPAYKGLHFINPDGKDKEVPAQCWTHGQTEYTSYWAPVIDRPNQRATTEIALTVPAKFVSLSNGTLAGKQDNPDGTRTDRWKMEQPHAPFLFFIGAGDFKLITDKYKNIPVSYYIPTAYESTANRIFGRTPAIMEFFSEKFGMEYPWSKLSLITGHQFGAAGMENTTAVLFTDNMLKNERQLTDETADEDVIVHEIAHQWLGDLVTPESWSNLFLSEAFATYSEYLWKEHVYGKEVAEQDIYKLLSKYTEDPRNSKKALARHYYRYRESLFDAVSYNKGACVLHLLRNYVGDDAFFQAVKLYLKRYSFQSVEASDLREAFEEVTGQDLNWFWNQWFYNPGHPVLDINYSYNDVKKEVMVTVSQTQQTGSIFKLPVYIDVYTGGQKQRHKVWVDNNQATFSFPADQKPTLVNFDGDRTLVCERKENKTTAEYVFQYQYSDKQADKIDAVVYALQHTSDGDAAKFLLAVIQDDKASYRYKELILKAFKSSGVPDNFVGETEKIAAGSKHASNRALAAELLGNLRQQKYIPLFEQALKDSSYTVAGAALNALAKIDQARAIAVLPDLRKDNRGALSAAIAKVEVFTKTDADFDNMYATFTSQDLRAAYDENFNTMFNFITYMKGVKDMDHFKKAVGAVMAFRTRITPYSMELKGMIDDALLAVKTSKQEQGVKDHVKLIEKELHDSK